MKMPLWIPFAGVLVVTAAAIGCYGHVHGGVAAPTAHVTVRSAPPPVRHEVVLASPGAGYVWVPGYWEWNGDAYVWIRGEWTYAEPGYRWVRPRYERRGGSYVYVRGYFYHSGRGHRVNDASHFRADRHPGKAKGHQRGKGRGHDDDHNRSGYRR